MLFEFDPSGLIVPSYAVHTMRLFIADQKWSRLTNGFGVFSTLLLLIFTVTVARHAASGKLRYLREAWNWLDIFILALGWTTFGLYFAAQNAKSAAVKLVTQADAYHFVGFYFALQAESAFLNMAAFCFFICTIKLLKILRITRKVNTLLYVLSDVTVPLLGFLLSFLLSIVPFIMAGHAIFGRSLKRNASFYSSFITILRIMVVDIGDLYKDYSESCDRVIGLLYFTLAVISVLYIYTNTLLALIMVIYSRTIEDRRQAIERDAELSDFVLQKLQGLLGIHVEHPVVDLSQFPATMELRDLSNVYKRYVMSVI